MKKIYLLLALFCLCIVVSATTVRVNGSPLNNGVTFTSSNLSVIKEGSISWDATKHELTLLNLTMECTNSNAIKVSNTDDVKIVLKGTSTINVSGAVDGIVLEGDSAYSIVYNNDYGTGKLTVTTTGKYSDGSVKSTCAAISTNSTLSFDKVNVSAYGPSGIRCNGTGSIFFTSSTVQARGLNGGSILGFEKATLTKSINDTSDGFSYNTDKKAYVDSNGDIVKTVVSIWRKYPLKVVGRPVTDKNCSDILGDGTVTYINQEYVGGILRLKNANISYNSGNIIEVDNGIGQFHINVEGTNTLNTNLTKPVLVSYSPVMIYSNDTNTPGKIVTSKSKIGYYCSGDLTFNNVNVNIFSPICFSANNSNAKLKFSSSIINAIRNTVTTSEIVKGFGSVAFDGTYITKPKALEYDADKGYYRSFGNKIDTLQISIGKDDIAPTANPSSKKITFTPLTSTSMRLTWLAAEDNMTPKSKLKYRIVYQKPSGWTFKEITGQNTADISGLSIGATYTFQIRAYDENNNAATIASDAVVFAYGDINGDCVVDINDLTAFIDMLNAGKAGEINMAYDLNHDGVIDEKDVQALADILLNK